MQCFAFLVFLRLWLDFLKISTLPSDFAKCDHVCIFFQPIRFIPQTGFQIEHGPTKYFNNLANVLHNSALLYCEYCSLVVKVSFVLFFWKLCVGFEVNFMFEFVVYIDIVEKVSTLPKYYVCLRRACTACMSLQKQD